MFDMHMFGDPAQWLPFTFAGLMGLSILIYVILDGFDLGIGVLFPFANDEEKDAMQQSCCFIVLSFSCAYTAHTYAI